MSSLHTSLVDHIAAPAVAVNTETKALLHWNDHFAFLFPEIIAGKNRKEVFVLFPKREKRNENLQMRSIFVKLHLLDKCFDRLPADEPQHILNRIEISIKRPPCDLRALTERSNRHGMKSSLVDQCN